MGQPLSETIRKIYLYRGFNDFILLYPLYNIMFAEHGLSLLQISVLLVIWSGTDLVTNVPMGVLADKYNRKNLLGLSQLVTAAGFLTWLLWPNFIGFAAGFILWGIGGALFDGTYEALVYDELKATGEEKHYVKIIGRANSIGLVSIFLATALAGLAVTLGYGFVIGASVVALIIAAVIAFTLPSAKPNEELADTRYFSMLKAGIRQAISNPVLLEIVLLGGFIGAIYGSLEEYVPLFFRTAGFSHALVSLMVAATVLAAAGASILAHHFEHIPTGLFMAVLAMAGLGLWVAAAVGGVSSVALLIGYTFIIKLLATVFDGKIQHSIYGDLRATVTSVALFAVEVISIGIYLIYGFISRRGGNFAAFKLIGLVVMAVAVMYVVIAPRLLSGRINVNG